VSIPIGGVADVRALVGRELGPTPWFTVEQRAVDQFADATNDHQWIHVDVERARAGRFGGTIAHGWLVVGLGPFMLRQILDLSAVAASINYGCNRVRFPAPTLVGSRIRMWLRVLDVADVPGGCRATLEYRFEPESGDRPVCVAEVLSQWTF
jgi:acyl dehydratase